VAGKFWISDIFLHTQSTAPRVHMEGEELEKNRIGTVMGRPKRDRHHHVWKAYIGRIKCLRWKQKQRGKTCGGRTRRNGGKLGKRAF
jgi:hypothetical protein